MSESSSHKNFTARDIERYHSGEMTQRERHDLEKAALDDPFLLDAMEGYVLTSTPQQDLANIRARLENESKDKAPPVILMNFRWMKIAALFLLIAMGGWLFVWLSNTGETPVARLENANRQDSTRPSSPIREAAPPVATDSITQKIPHESTAVNHVKVEKRSSEPKKGSAVVADAPLTVQTNALKEERQAVATVPPERDQLRQMNMAEEKVNYRNVQTRGKGPFSNRADGRYNNVIASNNMVMQRAMNTDSLAFVENKYLKTTNGNYSVSSSTDSVINVTVFLKPLPNSTPDVVVVGYGTRRDTVRWSRPTFLLDSLEPEIGWSKFDEYVASSIKGPEDGFKLKKAALGEVQLTFDINKDGDPVNITVGKSTCKSCEEKAIRILQEGPKWRHQRNKKGSITLMF